MQTYIFLDCWIYNLLEDSRTHKLLYKYNHHQISKKWDVLKVKETSLEKTCKYSLNKFNITISFLKSCEYLDIYLMLLKLKPKPYYIFTSTFILKK